MIYHSHDLYLPNKQARSDTQGGRYQKEGLRHSHAYLVASKKVISSEIAISSRGDNILSFNRLSNMYAF